MAPKQTDVEPSVKPWLAFRLKHEAELNGFHLEVKKAYEKFQQRVKQAKAALLAKHKKEEEEFWSKARVASKDKNNNENKHKADGAAVTIIDLCADDDEPVTEPAQSVAKDPIAKDYNAKESMLGSQLSNNVEPAVRHKYNIPSASLELFGKGVNLDTPEPSQSKREHSVFTNQLQYPSRPQTPPKPRQYISSMPPSPSPSPCTPIVEPLTLTTPGFRRPVLPASATKDSFPAARNVRPQAPASTYSASSITQSQCDSSVTSRTSVSSRSTVARGKRKVVDISSDEESEYSPPSDVDDEPKSPIITDEVYKSTDSNTKKPGPVTKKTKLPPPLPPAMVSKSVGKNGFEFQIPSKLKSNNNQAPFSSANPPPRTPINKPKPQPQPSAPSTSPSASKDLTKPATTTQVAPDSRPTRKAKLDASAKISQLSEAELQTRTNIAIDKANEYEAPEGIIIEQARSSFRSMSITPAPSMAAEHVEMLADMPDPEKTTPTKRTNAKNSTEWNTWTYSRVNGDRYLGKSRPNRRLVQDDEDERDDPDISKYIIVNGIILHEANLEYARLTKEQDRRDVMRSKETDGGSRARTVSVVKKPKHKAVGQSERLARRIYGRK